MIKFAIVGGRPGPAPAARVALRRRPHRPHPGPLHRPRGGHRAIWRFLYNPTFGGLNATLRALYDLTGGLIGSAQGLPWTGDPTLALQAMVAVNVWKGVPFFTLLALAGLKAIASEQYDAAVDGANAWQRFLHVTLPGLRYVIIVETLFSTISTFNTFGLVYLITGAPAGPPASTPCAPTS